jgi:CspA family cold shock protein
VAQGRVKWYSANLGYGFIAPDGEDEDILVRHEDVAGNGFENLENGARVTYEPVQGREGTEAKNVSRSA